MKCVYFGGEIITMERELYAPAVLTENGVITAVGQKEDLLRVAGQKAFAIDLCGSALLPGFIDTHSHITALASTMRLVSLEGAKDFHEIASRMKRHIAEKQIPPGEWVAGFGYDQNGLKEKTHPDKGLLDSVSLNHPILIAHASGHMGAANTPALQALGISADSPDPEGGRIGREPGSRDPNGFLEEAAFLSVSAKIPQPCLSDQCGQVAEAQEIYLQNGVTTIQDGLTKQAEYALLQAAAQSGLLKADVVCYADLKNCPGLGECVSRQYDNRLRMGGYKIFLDGSPQGHTAYMTQPYAESRDGYRGYPVYTDEEVCALTETAYREGAQLLAHCNGDAAAQQWINAVARAEKRFPGRGLRPVMIHAQLVRPDQLREMAALSMIASFFAAHIYEWGDVHLQNFGRERGGRISPAGSAHRAGTVYTFHQDTPVLPPDMLTTMWCAVNRVTREGVQLDETEKISVLDAVKGVTVNAAYQYFEESRKGSIAPGKNADFVLLDHNPLRMDPQKLREARVLATIKDGVCVYERSGAGLSLPRANE